MKRRTMHSPCIELQYRFSSDDTNLDCWHPLSRPWQTAADDWVVTHDIFHHDPLDGGTVLEELATLGAEYWINHSLPNANDGSTTLAQEIEKVESALCLNASGIFGMAFDAGGCAPNDFVFELVPTSSLDEVTSRIFAAIEASAGEELRYQAGEGAKTESAWRDAVAAFDRKGVLASHIAHGYFKARERYPDRDAVRAAFRRLETRLNNLAKSMIDGSVLTISRRGCDVTTRVGVR